MLTLYYHPESRGLATLWLLEELQVPHEAKVVDIRGVDGAPESYRAIHPHKKVPAIVHDGVTIIERSAISIYLADRFPKMGLAPAFDDPMRGPYLAWTVYNSGVLDPALSATALGWNYDPRTVAFGAWDEVVAYVEQTLKDNPYIAGDRFTAADTQMASSLHWGINIFGKIPAKPVFKDYLARIYERPAFQKIVIGAQNASAA
ncbi:glutathione S-transferase family protein [Lacibacterium aquatile]|uniref:Glutathione S-transferase family protein n=1 Tax=Lacibacterium aquatile TaxID=1168082 RepID=A0ABW5DM31_9PROT